jgi:hypothetical protein
VADGDDDVVGDGDGEGAEVAVEELVPFGRVPVAGVLVAQRFGRLIRAMDARARREMHVVDDVGGAGAQWQWVVALEDAAAMIERRRCQLRGEIVGQVGAVQERPLVGGAEDPDAVEADDAAALVEKGFGLKP